MLYLDELQILQTPDLATLAAQIRKYGVGVVQACQWLSQLNPENRAAALAAANFIAGQVSTYDAPAVSWKFDNTPEPGPLKWEPVRFRSHRAPGYWEQAFVEYGGRFGEDRHGLSEPVKGDPVSTNEMRDRKANLLVQLPFAEFYGRLRRGNEFEDVRFRSLPSACHGDMPAWVEAVIHTIRERSRKSYAERYIRAEPANVSAPTPQQPVQSLPPSANGVAHPAARPRRRQPTFIPKVAATHA